MCCCLHTALGAAILDLFQNSLPLQPSLYLVLPAVDHTAIIFPHSPDGCRQSYSIAANLSNQSSINIIKYLGIILSSAKRFTLDYKETRRKFFVSVNTIFSKCKFTSDKLELLERQCLPILLGYGGLRIWTLFNTNTPRETKKPWSLACALENAF